MKNKKAQEVMGMSFGTIFSIILIVLIIAVAFFAIRHFLNLSRCTNLGLFYTDLQDEIEDGWSSTSGRYQGEFVGKIPQGGLFASKIKYVCFGRLSSNPVCTNCKDSEIRSELSQQYDPGSNYNVFMYPTADACDDTLGAYKLKCNGAECINTKDRGSEVFFCKAIESDGSLRVWLSKEPTDYQVSIRASS